MGCFLHLEAVFDALLELNRQVKKTKSMGRHFYISGNKIRLLARRTTNFTTRAFLPSKRSKTGSKVLDLSPPSSPRTKVKEVPEWSMNYEEFDKQSFKHDDIFDANGELTPAAIAFNKKSAEMMASKRDLTPYPKAHQWDSDSDSDTGTSGIACYGRNCNKVKEYKSNVSNVGRNGKKRQVVEIAGAYFEVSDSE